MKTYCGYDIENDWIKLNYKDFTSKCKGELIMAIGEGKFNDVFHSVMQQAMAYGAYNNEKAGNK
jgi:hypothetical protein